MMGNLSVEALTTIFLVGVLLPLSAAISVDMSYGNHQLAVEAANRKHLTTREIKRYMDQIPVQIAWAVTREVCPLQKWTWEDGSDHTEHITTNKAYRRADQLCGTVKAFIGIDDHACFERLNYICSFPDLSRNDPNGTCMSKYDRSFCLYKDRCNYFSARDKCREKRGILVTPSGIISTSVQLESVLKFFSQYLVGEYDRAWIGTRKIDICAVSDDGSVTFARHIRWAPGQPNFNFRCLVWKLDNQAMQMMTANCSEDHAYFLVKEDKISYTHAGSALVHTAPPKGTNNGFVVKANVVIVCSVIMMIVFMRL